MDSLQGKAHQLIVDSLHDAQAHCRGCGWHYIFTGERTHQQIAIEFLKSHETAGDRKRRKEIRKRIGA